MGGNVLCYDGNTSAPTSDLTTLNLLINSAVSTPKAKCMTLGIKNYYLATTLAEKQHMLIHADLVPEETHQAHNFQLKIAMAKHMQE